MRRDLEDSAVVEGNAFIRYVVGYASHVVCLGIEAS